MMAHRTRFATLLGGAALLTFAGADYAAAQQGLDAEASAAGIAEVIVTAQRRSENLQSVPISITALSADELRQQGVGDSLALSNVAPNVEIKTFGGVPNIFIRGVGNNDFNATTISPVSIYRDEVAITSTASQIFPLFDTARVEVLRGPQGTLFGRNTTGGAISFISQRPSDDLEGYLTAGYGRFDLRTIEGAISLPLTDSFGVRVSALSRQRDGQRRNAYTHQMVDTIDLSAARIVAQYEPTGDLSITAIATTARDRSDYSEGKPIGILPGGVDALGYSDPYPNDTNTYNYNTDTLNNADTAGGAFIVEYDFGGAVLKSITGVDQAQARNYVDVDMSPNHLDEVDFKSETSQISQEFNLSGDSDRLTWIAGLYYSYDDIDYDVGVNLLNGIIPLHVLSARETRTYAGYGQATYSITPSMRLTGGVRYTTEEQEGWHLSNIAPGINDPAVPDGPESPALPYQTLSVSDNAFTWRLALDVDLNDDTLGYVSINRGFKSGGFYLTALVDPLERAIYDPEYLTAYEIGLKSTMFDGRLRVNGDIFHYQYTDLQVLSVSAASGPVPSIVLENAADASVDGLELQIQARPTEDLSLWANVGLLKARYGSYPSASVDALGNVLDYSGNRLPGAPDVTFNAGAAYDFRLPHDLILTPRVDVAYMSQRYFSSEEDPLVGDEAYTLFNARITLTPESERWALALWGKNIGDTEYLANATNLYSLGFAAHYLADRQSYGAELTYRFGQ